MRNPKKKVILGLSLCKNAKPRPIPGVRLQTQGLQRCGQALGKLRLAFLSALDRHSHPPFALPDRVFIAETGEVVNPKLVLGIHLGADRAEQFVATLKQPPANRQTPGLGDLSRVGTPTLRRFTKYLLPRVVKLGQELDEAGDLDWPEGEQNCTAAGP
eukprot:scaffold1954_cov268-Pinguiococcus_pyrenoidosus.AAC.273